MLHVHRAERADRLVAGLADVLRDGLDDPFAPELVAVPAKGVERWLTQRLAHATDPQGREAGICANVRFTSSRALIDEVVSALAAAGTDEQAGRTTGDDVWSPGHMLFGLLGLGSVGEWQLPPDRPVAAASDLARLFAAYRSQRPDLLRRWAAGDDGALPPDLRWQPPVWRALRGVLGRPNPAELLDDVCDRLSTDVAVVDLPPRLSVFGPTRLTRDQLAVLGALAVQRDLHLWLPHPSPALWDAVAPLAAASARSPRRDDPTALVPQHPLLASLGRDSRELQLLLAGASSEVTHHHHALPARPATLLGRLQADLAADTVSEPAPLLPGDRSVQVHACHGPSRQVEVLREALLGLLADDPTLEPRDVLVMCPDIEAYAPLISATFGLADPEVPGGERQ